VACLIRGVLFFPTLVYIRPPCRLPKEGGRRQAISLASLSRLLVTVCQQSCSNKKLESEARENESDPKILVSEPYLITCLLTLERGTRNVGES
jgi:hypothetical protein